MADYAFYQLNERILQQMNLPTVPFPVRRQEAATIFGAKRVAIEGLLDELHAYLLENPAEAERYRAAAVSLAYVVGLHLGSRGDPERAAHYLALGLSHAPDHLPLRVYHALALQLAGKRDEATREYAQVFSHPQAQVNPIVWTLAARLYMDRGDYSTALQILDQCAPIVARTDPFWKLYRYVQERATPAATVAPVPPPSPASASVAAQAACAQCGAALGPSDGFCGRCGAARRAD